MQVRELNELLEEAVSAYAFNAGAFAMLARRLELTGQRPGDLSVAEFVNTVKATRRDFNAIYGPAAVGTEG